MYAFTQDILNKLSQEQKDKFLLDNLNSNSTLNSNFITANLPSDLDHTFCIRSF